MENMTYSDFRSHLATALDRVNDSRTPILVTRQSGKAAVLMSLEDFNSYEETAYLMSSAENAKRLNEAIAELEKKKGKHKKLIEE
jgi:antitoxin YefM